MPFAGLVLCVCCAVVAYFSEKRVLLNPVTVFCSVWAFVLLLSSLHLYTLYLPTARTYAMITSGIFCFVIGYIVYQRFARRFTISLRGRNLTKDVSGREDVLRYQLMYVLLVAAIFLTLLNLVSVVGSLGSFSLKNVQMLLQSDGYENNRSAVLNAFSILVLQPFGFAVPAVVAVDWWKGRRDHTLLTLSVIYIILRMFSSASRTSLVLLFLFFFMVAVVGTYNSGRSERKQMFGRAAPFLAVGVIAFILMSVSRGSNIRNIYLDFAIAPEMFEIWAGKIEEEAVTGYGLSGVFGWVYSFFYIIKNLSANLLSVPNLVQNIYDWIDLTDTQWVWPGEKINANAYVSVFWNFYVDGRWPGIVIEMFLFGIFSAAIYRRATVLYTKRGMALYCIMFYALLFSFVRYQFSLSKVALSLIYIGFVLYKRKPSSG